MMGTLAVKAPPVCDGVVNIAKPIGWTSHDVVNRLRRDLGLRKVGHAGTLDPAATGVLPVLLGKGTRISDYLMSWDKEYEGILRLGQETDTQDATGVIVKESPVAGVTQEMIMRVTEQFRGKIQQIPPMYSAIKVAGQPLYKAARAGREVARQSRSVMIHRLEIIGIHGQDVSFRVVCSKGTYVRTLCADFGAQLGVGGHLYTLQRVRVGPLHVSQSLPPIGLGNQGVSLQDSASFLVLDEALSFFPAVTVDSSAVPRLLNGCAVQSTAVTQGEVASNEPKQLDWVFRVKDPFGRLLGLGRFVSSSTEFIPTDSRLRMIKVLAEPSSGHSL